AGGERGAIMGRIFRRLDEWNEGARAATASADRGFTLRRDPDVLSSDVSFVKKDRETAASLHGCAPIAPDLAVEVRSENDTWASLLRKAQMYLDFGCAMVVLPGRSARAGFIEVHRPGGGPKRLELDDVWHGQDVLPGFSCRVRNLFPAEVL
ncbi:MAG: Uma2 family endonuclease, partial [Chloroflexi bacterium]|nr:Uma2 family endonuclease [Chloroflexota bacterium]